MFSGRINRKYFLLILTILFAFSILFSQFADSIENSGATDSLLLTIFAIILLIIFSLISISIHIKRFHDIGYSGWFIFILIVPLSSFFLGLIPGEKADNKYGKKPK